MVLLWRVLCGGILLFSGTSDLTLTHTIRCRFFSKASMEKEKVPLYQGEGTRGVEVKWGKRESPL